MDIQLENSDTLLFNVHSASVCGGRSCPLHRRTQHLMRTFPQHWRGDTGIVERVCPHGVGHPDPDGWDYLVETWGKAGAVARMIHGCDGCCAGTVGGLTGAA